MGELYQRMKADLELGGYSARTQGAYLDYAKNFVGHYMRPAEELTEREVRCFLLHQLHVRQVGPASIKMYVAALKFLYEVTLKRPEVTKSLVWPKVPKPLPDVLSLREVMRLLEAIGLLLYRAVLTTAYATGMRISETCRLQVGDIDSERGLIHVRRGKGGKDRYVMAGEELLACLRQYWRKTKPSGPYLFPGRRSPAKPVAQENVRRELKRAAERAGIEKPVSVHGLRHAFATHMLEAGVDLRTLQFLMGHESIGTTARYTRISAHHVANTPSPLDLMKAESSTDPAEASEGHAPLRDGVVSPKPRTSKRKARSSKARAPKPASAKPSGLKAVGKKTGTGAKKSPSRKSKKSTTAPAAKSRKKSPRK